MSLFKFGFVPANAKRKNDKTDEDGNRKEQKLVYEETKRERKYLGNIWEKKYIYYKTVDGKPDGKTNPTTWI